MTDQTDRTRSGLSFDPPGPGQWELETSHHGLRPLTPFLREAYRGSFESGIREPLQRYGLPLATVQARFVHGCLYMRPLGIGERPDATPKAPPPAFVMKVITRLHPELRRRAKTAAQAFEGRTWRHEVDQWFDHDRATQLDRNLTLQAVDPGSLDDAELAAHIATCLEHYERSARRNLATHGGDLIPSGDLLAHCDAWGIGANDAMGLLTGSSPATIETAEMLQPVARALRDRTGTEPLHSVDDVRALGPDVRAAIDAWLRLHAWRTVMSDDIDRPTLAEAPALQLAALLAASTDVEVGEPDVADLRARVPADQRARFDELVVEARYGHRQRDDIRGLCWNWPAGLVRRALLEAGRRLHAKGRLHEIAHVVEFFPDELEGLLAADREPGADDPTADDLADRAAERDRIEATPPPRALGEPEEAPSLDVFPPALARMTAALMISLAADSTPTPQDAGDSSIVTGVGIGTTPYRGRACVVTDLMLAFDELQQGDVLITPITGPSANSLLPVVGALVVEEGGPVCHAAIVAREFGITAVIGAQGATARIPHGAHVEVDPGRGTVRVV